MPLHPLKLTAGAFAAIAGMVIGSTLNDAGTLWGAGIGSVAYSIFAEGFEYAGAKAHHVAKNRLRRTLSDPRDPAKKVFPVTPAPKIRSPRKWIYAATGLGIAAVSCASALIVMSFTEAASGKTLHGAITNSADYGSTIGSHQSDPVPAPTIAPSDARPSPSLTASPTTTLVPSPTMTATPVPTLTPSPSLTMIPATTPAAPAPAASSTVTP